MRFKTLLAVCGIIGLFALALPARADIYSTKGGTFTNSASGPFFGNTTTNLMTGDSIVGALTVTSDPIPLRQGWGLALMPSFIGTNTVITANVTNIFDLGAYVGTGSTRTTNWTTTGPVKLITSLNGATAVLDGTNVPRATLENFALIRWTSIGCAATTGRTNKVTISNLIYSYSSYTGP